MSVTQFKSEEAFKTALKTDSASLVMFSATWCGPCKQITPKLPVLAEQFPKISFYKVDVDELESLAESENATSLPTFKLYADEKCVKVVVGSSIDKIRAALEELYEVKSWSQIVPTNSSSQSTTPAATTTESSSSTTSSTATTTTSTQGGTGTIIEIQSTQEFGITIQKPFVLAYFAAPWCGPCKQLAPYLKTLAEQYKHVNFIKIDFDDYEEIAEQYDVSSLPTLVFFQNGKKVHAHIGVNKDKINAAFQEHFPQ